jgi:hypothetical protein
MLYMVYFVTDHLLSCRSSIIMARESMSLRNPCPRVAYCPFAGDQTVPANGCAHFDVVFDAVDLPNSPCICL